VDLERIDQQPIASLNGVWATLLEPEVGRVEENAVRAVRVDDVEASVGILNRSMSARDKLIG
jgi:hypothetical protein